MAIYDISGVQLSDAYRNNGVSLDVAYDANGNVIYTKEPYAPSLTFLHSINMSTFSQSVVSPQGMAVYGKYIAQYFAPDDTLRFIDTTDWSVDGAYSLTEFLHGNGLVFGDTVQTSGFPLLYASQFGTSQESESRLIAIAEVGLSSYTIKGYYDIPSSAGYHPQFVADWQNEKGYTIGYRWLATSSGDMKISSYNINDMTTVVDQWEVPYMGVVQGSCFWNGYIVVIGDSYNYSSIRVTFINVSTHEKTEFQLAKYQSTDMEFQGVGILGNDLLVSSWVYDSQDSGILKYWIYKINLPQNGQSIES